MKKLEDIFSLELIQRAINVEQEFGINMKKFTDTINKFGGVKTAKEIIKKGQTSQGFDTLCEKDRLELSMEELVTESKFGELFTDDEVNYCFALLCENNFYKLK